MRLLRFVRSHSPNSNTILRCLTSNVLKSAEQMSTYIGLDGVPYPLVPGHVSVGRLSKIRGQLIDVDGRPFREGERVTFLDVHRTCNACWYCLVAKASTSCPHRKVYGITYGLKDGLCGGWAEQIYLKPGTHCIHVETNAETFMAGGCALPTALHAVERGEIRLGDNVLVLGS